MPAFGGFGTSNNNTTPSFPNDFKPIEVPGSPDDTVSQLRFCPKVQNGQTFFCASSWANDIRLWSFDTNTGACTAKNQKTHQQPILDCCWSTDGSKIFTACADNSCNMWDIASDQFQQIAAHDGPISTVNIISVNGSDILMTGSWDKKLRFWDCKQPKPVFELDLGYRIYGADACFPVAVTIGSEKKYSVISFQNGTPQILQNDATNQAWPEKLQRQYSCVSIFKDKNKNYAPDGFAIGCAEGRVAVTYFDTNARKQVDPKKSSSVSFDPNFAFKCHRVEYKTDSEKKVIDGKQVAADAYTINFIRFHPEFQTLITAGADGKYVFWDKDHRTRLGPNMSNNQKYEFPLPLTAGDVSADGKFMIFATGYDWSFGFDYSNLQKNKPQIYIHPKMVNQANTTEGTLVPKNK